MKKNTWHRAIEMEKLSEGGMTSVLIDGEDVLLTRVEGRVYACCNECTHLGAPLSEGLLTDHTITCSWHNARFDVREAAVLAPPALVSPCSFDTEVRKGVVYIRRRSRKREKLSPGRDKRTFLIVGAGASGSMAALTLRREGYSGRIVMINAEEHPPYDRTVLSKRYLTGNAPDEDLLLHDRATYENLQIEMANGHPAVDVDAGERRVILDDGRSLQGEKILLATGGMPRRLGISGDELRGCFTLRTLADSRAIVEHLKDAGQAVIMGASFIGLEVASSLRKRDIEVHVVALEKVPLGAVFGEEIGRRVLHMHEENGVRFHLGRRIVEFRGGERVREALLQDGESLDADIVIIGAGIIPSTEYLRDSGLAENGEVPVNGRLETGAEGVFASGDLALVPDRRTGEQRRTEHWVEAERQGRHAARCMLGLKKNYEEPPFFWTRQYGESIKYIGHASGQDRIVFREGVDEGEFLVGYFREGQLLAAATLGKDNEFTLLCELLRRGGNLTQEHFRRGAIDRTVLQ
jgi:NADPH-dependent 2,4-dienoyl-CoA reductase/sulfur reductase-like enzyme/nitrite reductase/ring-hydroxylating ferredoxin subunit